MILVEKIEYSTNFLSQGAVFFFPKSSFNKGESGTEERVNCSIYSFVRIYVI